MSIRSAGQLMVVRLSLALSFMLLIGGSTFTTEARANHPHHHPNVIVMLVDDWGWTDAGCQGSDLYQTPNIDRLAKSGVRFTNAYSACTVCSPTRAAMMTGLSPARTHVTDWIPGYGKGERKLQIPDWTMQLEYRYTTLAEALKGAGYKTALFGKWHLTPAGGLLDERPFWPDRHGFELNIGGNQYGAPGSYFAPFSGTKRPMWNMPPSNNGDYLDDRLIDVALQTMEQWREGPFFFYIPFYLVHTPLEAKPKLLEKYRQLVRTEARHTIPEYAAMVEALDTNIGRLLDGLDRLGIADDTLVILTSDNGGLDMHESGRPTNNAPLRNGKGTAYEGGVRVPAFVRLHDVTPAGAECAEPIITMDYFPTILSLCEIETPIVQRDEFDGQDISTVLRDPTSKLPERSLYWHYPHYHSAGGTPYSAIRKGDYRLIEFLETDHVELYNLANDISEQTDLARQDPTRAASMREELHAWRKNVGAQLPTPVANN